MNEANLVSRISQLVTGDSYLTERPLPLSVVRSASGLPLGTAVSATVDASSTATDEAVLFTFDGPQPVASGISFDDGETALLTILIPQDYDEVGDRAALRLIEVPSASAADTTDLGITSAQTIFRAGAAADSTAATAVAEDATSSVGALVRENILDISGRGFKAGDVVQFTLDGNNSGTTEIILTGIGLIYGSTIRGFNDDDNERSLGV